jgi:putative component of toxin-antitoxin plasmid stabilization module
MKFYKHFADWSDALDRKAKGNAARIKVRRVKQGYIATLDKVQIGTFEPRTGGYVY